MSQSNISSEKYGYSYVVSTTQAAINATMKQWLFSLKSPVINMCYIMDASNKPQVIDYEELKRKANGTDPFLVKRDADPNGEEVQNLYRARFAAGFRVKLGIPHGMDVGKIPDIVTLDAGGSSVMFNLFCSDFKVVELAPGYGNPTWFAATQTPFSPWMFQAKVDLSLSTVEKTDYAKMPPAVQAEIKNKGAMAFSVQQLWFDLSTAALYNTIELPGVERGSTLDFILSKYFVNSYMRQARDAGNPLLGVNIVDHLPGNESMRLTDLTMTTSQYVDGSGRVIPHPTPQQKSMATLNYLCAADGAVLPPARSFDFNWVDTSEALDRHGVMAINRNTFAKWIEAQVINKARSMCYEPRVRVTTDGWTTWYEWWASPWQNPTVIYPTTGSTVLRITYESSVASDKAGGTEEVGGRMKLYNTYDMTVEFVGTQIVVKQHMVFWTMLRYLSTQASGNIVDRYVTDTYDIGVNADHELTWNQTASPVDKRDYDMHVNKFLNFFTKLNDLINDVQIWANAFANTHLTAPPIAKVSKFVFPGGEVFAFKNARFSTHQDLVAALTYKNPKRVTTAGVSSVSSVTSTRAPTVYKAVVPKHRAVAMTPKQLDHAS